MATLVVTISGPEGSADLSVPAETPIDQLVPTFLSLGVVQEVGGNGHGFGIARAGEAPLPGASSLTECGVVDGTILHLTALTPVEARPAPAKVVKTTDEWREIDDRSALERRSGFPIGRTEAALPDEPGLGERLGGAIGSFLSKESADAARPTVAPLEDREASGRPTARPSDLSIHRPTSRVERARASWRDTNYLRRLDQQIAEPRLRRCATIAIVSPKGGVGKTTMTALLGALLVQVRHERIVAVDSNPDYGSLGPALTPDHRVFVDDLRDLLDHPNLTVAELDRKLGRAFDGLLVVPAPTDPGKMAQLGQAAYAKVFSRLQTMVSGLVLDCGTGLQEPPARAAIEAADQIVLVSDAEPSTASLVTEASRLLARSGPPLFVVVNKVPKRGQRLDLEQVSRAIPEARGLVALAANPDAASQLNAGEFSWAGAPSDWQRHVRELAAVMVKDWPGLGLSA
jgi:MinD-like ATPase involved in chromosome partitioning or flagellar assembly